MTNCNNYTLLYGMTCTSGQVIFGYSTLYQLGIATWFLTESLNNVANSTEAAKFRIKVEDFTIEHDSA